MPPIQFAHVWKRYAMGTQHDSLRDAIPALLKRLAGRNGRELKPDEFWAVKDVSFEVRRGETLGLVGPNGAGKSTILKLLSKITRQTKGSIAVRGRVAALIELGGGFHPDLSGRENIFLQGTMLGMSTRQIRRALDSIIAFSELETFLDTPIKRYSSGMVVRLGFAIAAHIHPDVLLLDEVLAVGDLAFQQKCFTRIAELQKQRTTMIFISHNLEAVQQLCDRVVLLDQGRAVAEGGAQEIIQRYRDEVFASALKSNTQLLHSDGALAIRHVLLRGEDGNVVGTLGTGQPLQVEVGYVAHRPIRHPSVRVRLERLDGLVCHATSTRRTTLLPEVLTGEGAIALSYQALNLLPNLYQVAVDVFEDDSFAPVATVRQSCFLQVTSEHHEEGMVHLDHAWSVPPQSPEPVSQIPGGLR